MKKQEASVQSRTRHSRKYERIKACPHRHTATVRSTDISLTQAA